MFIASLIEFSNTQTWQKVNIQLANFDMASLRVWEIHPVMKMDVVR
jgi:hypothetical protein